MWAINSRTSIPRPRPDRQTGTAAIEFAMLAMIFFTFIFGIIEVARIGFLYNTLQEVTRRAAYATANAPPGDIAALNRIRQGAIFRTSAGELVLGAPVTDQHVRIDYMALTRDTTTGALTRSQVEQIPATPAQNRLICMGDPNSPNCIRLVRVRICEPGSAECRAVQSPLMIPLLQLSVPLPAAETTTSAESLGYTQGMVP
jgi:hypothetical protein